MNLLTEDNLPYYHLALWEIFGRGGVWGEWVRRWTAEEGRHAIVLRDYLTVTRGLDPVAARTRADGPGLARLLPRRQRRSRALDPLDGVVYTTLQELATRIAHRNTGTFTQDPIIEKLTARIATDENLHYVFYRELGKAALEIAPSEMMLAINRQVTGFAMPGLDIPEFKAKAIEIAKAGIYDLRIHHDEVVLPVLFTHWKIDQVTGLTDEAEQARDGITNYLDDAGRDGVALRGEARGPRVGLAAHQAGPSNGLGSRSTTKSARPSSGFGRSVPIRSNPWAWMVVGSGVGAFGPAESDDEFEPACGRDAHEGSDRRGAIPRLQGREARL